MKMPATTKAEASIPNSVQFNKMPTFTPRHKRGLWALWNGPLMRDELGRVAGASNAPGLVAELRAKGIDIHCELVERIDRDGKSCWPGRYSLTSAGRATLRGWNWGPEQ